MRKNKYGTYGTFSRSFSRVLAAAFVAAVAAGTMPVYSAYAASPSFARTEEEWAKLRDNVIEYDELEGLIHEYNATVQNNQYTYQKFRQDYGDTNEEVAQEYYKLAQDYYNDMSGDDDASSRMSDLNLQIQGDNMQKQGDETLEDSRIYLLTYEQAEKNLVVTAQSDMISYYENLIQKEQAEATLTEAKENLALAQTKLSAGTITQLDLLTAQENVQTAENNLTQLENTIKNLKENFQVLLGWSYNDSPEIGSLTDVDENEIAAMNPDTDLAQAIENNYTLKINERKLENAKNETVKNQLTTAIANNKKQIGASLSGAYKKVLSAQISLQQAQTKAQLEQTNLSNAALKMAAGMSTAADVLEKENQLLSARSSLSSLEESLNSTYSSLCLMVGRDTDSGLVICEIPAADLAKADSMDLEADTKKAIGNNSSLISSRGTKATSTAAKNNRNATVEEGEQNLTIQMNQLYENVLLKKSELQAAQTAFRKAEGQKKNADIKYSAGLLSQEEYLTEEMNYISQTASYKAADLAFTQAADTYGWAVMGITQ